MPRPTPQRAAEAPQRAMSSPFLVERAGAGPGSLHGAVERREGTPAAVRPEAARPTPQKGAEAPQRAVSSPSDSQVQRQERQKPLEKKEPHQQHSQTPRLRMR